MTTNNKAQTDLKKENGPERPILPNGIGHFTERLSSLIGKDSIRGFARKCFISEGALRSYLSGNSEPGMTALISIAKATGVNIEWLATGKGPMRSGNPEKDMADSECELCKGGPQGPGHLLEPQKDDQYVELDILGFILTAIEKVLEKQNVKITPEHKADIILLAYNLFRKMSKNELRVFHAVIEAFLEKDE